MLVTGHQAQYASTLFGITIMNIRGQDAVHVTPEQAAQVAEFEMRRNNPLNNPCQHRNTYRGDDGKIYCRDCGNQVIFNSIPFDGAYYPDNDGGNRYGLQPDH